MDALFRLAMRERHGAVTRAKRAVYSTERGGSLSVETYLMDPAGEDGDVYNRPLRRVDHRLRIRLTVRGLETRTRIALGCASVVR